MKAAFLIPIALALAGAALPAASQHRVQSNRAVFQAGNWFVVRSTHRITGAVGCTGFYRGQPGVQLSKENLIIRIPGELKSIGLRFGDRSPQPPRAPGKIEQEMGAVVLDGADFEQLRGARTLVLDVVTAQDRASHTLQLEGLGAALKNIDGGCPLTPAIKRAEQAAKKARERAEAERCSPKGIARMRDSGMPELRIKSACPKADLTPR